MKLNIVAETRQITRGGIEARVPELYLTAHGLDKEEALQSLKRGIVAWCEGLQSAGKLEKALKHKKIDYDADSAALIVDFIDKKR